MVWAIIEETDSEKIVRGGGNLVLKVDHLAMSYLITNKRDIFEGGVFEIKCYTFKNSKGYFSTEILFSKTQGIF